MRKYLIVFLSLLAARQGMGQFQPQASGSSVQFRVKNLGFNVTGSMTGLAGKIQFDPARLGDATFDVTVDAATINTDNGMRDDHLRGESYFNVQHYARIHLVSTSVSPHRKGSYLFTGQLTIKDHTKEISFPFTATAAEGGYRFQGSFTMNRRDFEVGGFSTISDQLEVMLDVTAK
jgi:polyisoprenoid-binding protein YceI